MTDPIPSQIDELLERRATYSRWLDRLEEATEEARPEVVRRIRSDYQDRLEEVRSELAEHRQDLAEDLDRRTGRVEGLEADREEALARREEAELRHRVGEYDDERWERVRGEMDAAIRELEGDLESERDATDQLRSALEIIDSSPTPRDEAAEESGEGADGATVEASDEETTVAASDAETGEDTARAGEADGEDRPPLRLVDRRREEQAGEEEAGEEEAQEESSPRPAWDVPAGETAAGGDEPPSEGRDEPPSEGRGESDEGEADEGTRAYDELEFLESLSLDDADQFDAVSAMLDAADEGEDDDAAEDSPREGSGDGRREPSGGGEG